MSNKIIVKELTINTVYEAIMILAEDGVEVDSPISVDRLVNTGAWIISSNGTQPKPRARQRCRTKDAQGRRCIRGPRHPESHRYENADEE